MSLSVVRYSIAALACACLTADAMVPMASIAFAQAAQPAPFINILAGPRGGVFYPFGTGILDILVKSVPEAKSSVQATNGSPHNLGLLQQRKGEIAFVQGDVLDLAWKGLLNTDVKGKFAEVRAIGALHQNFVHLIALKSGNIRHIGDLKGKRISVGPANSGTELNARAVLNASGLSYADLAKVDYAPYEAAVDAMKNGNIDAAFQTSGLGLPAIRELAAAFPLTFIAVDERVAARLGAPFVHTVLPRASYAGQDTEVPAIAIPNYLVTRSDIPETVVYAVTRALFSSIPELAMAHSAASTLSLDGALTGLPVPLHPGAERFYRERGLMK